VNEAFHVEMRKLPFRTVLYATLLVILNTRLGEFPESGPLAFFESFFESLELLGGSSSSTSSMLQSYKAISVTMILNMRNS